MASMTMNEDELSEECHKLIVDLAVERVLYDELEAKLAKAREALEQAGVDLLFGDEHNGSKRIRDALAAIDAEGGG
jgi:deoxycytidylate deaminase